MSTSEIVCRGSPLQTIHRQRDLIGPETLRLRPQSVENVPNSAAKLRALQGSGGQDTEPAERATRGVTRGIVILRRRARFGFMFDSVGGTPLRGTSPIDKPEPARSVSSSDSRLETVTTHACPTSPTPVESASVAVTTELGVEKIQQ